MKLEIREHVPLGPFTTFKLGGEARYFAEITEKEHILELHQFAQGHFLEVFVLGKGSNCVFADKLPDMCVGLMDIGGFEIVSEDAEHVVLKIGSGEMWDEIVSKAVSAGLSGIEAMSAIPGTAGATPVQNVGAYGQEIKDTLVELEAFDTTSAEFVILKNEDCHFGYRTSVFNRSEKGRYIISSITLKLSKEYPKMPEYPGVRSYFEKKMIEAPTLAEIRQAIIDIRASKLPDPSVVPNVGSFFKNVIVEEGKAREIAQQFPDMPSFVVSAGMVKIPSGWLIEKAGLKGRSFGHFSIYEHNALVLTHDGEGSFEELKEAEGEIVRTVEESFGIRLEHEPIFIA